MARTARGSITTILILAVAWGFARSDANTAASSTELPIGTIAIWPGSLSEIPAGWVLCDGSGGTPDLRGRLVRGAAPGDGPGLTGGSPVHQHDVSVHSHAVPASVHSHAISANTQSALAGVHDHALDPGQVQGTSCTIFPPNCSTTFAASTHGHAVSSAGSHGHSMTFSTASDAALLPASSTSTASETTNDASSLPAHRKVAFIMKVGA